MKDVKLYTEYIKLDQFLKLVNETSSGGEAKVRILSGEVKLNGVDIGQLVFGELLKLEICNNPKLISSL